MKLIYWFARQDLTSHLLLHCRLLKGDMSLTQLLTWSSEVKGANGVTMAEEFDPEPQCYLAVTVPKFPNYFVVNGVRGKGRRFQAYVLLANLHQGNWANGSALPSVSERSRS